LRYLEIDKASINNGMGIRCVLFVSGCNHCCLGCHNSNSWDFNCGNIFTKKTEDKILKYLAKPEVDGITFSGGDPLAFSNRNDILKFAKRIKEELPHKNIWCYTGYTWEELDGIDLSCIDVLVDGEFELNNRDITLAFRGSSNQRIIDVKASLDSNKVVLLNLEG
jgi:anaerobic ribonucleoside-triphosphate reductase activating protein